MSPAPERDQRPPARLIHFAGIFIPVLALCLVALASVAYSNFSRLTSDARNEQSRLALRVGGAAQMAFDTLNRQTDALVREGYLYDYISGRTDSTEALAQRYRNIIANAPALYQMQLIDENGNEVIRVTSDNGSTELASIDSLQNRRYETYFAEAANLPEGERYISPVRLNTRNGVPIDPPQPLTIYALPVFTEDGDRWGVLTAWIYTAAMLESIGNVENPIDAQLWILNRGGYWMLGPERGMEWGHEFPERAQYSLPTQDPGLWQEVLNNDDLGFAHEGSFYIRIPVCGDGFCSVDTVAPDTTLPLNLPESGWYIMSKLSAEQMAWNTVLLNNYAEWLPLALVLVLITLLSAWIAWRHATAVMTLRAHETRLFQLNDELEAEKNNLEKRVAERTTQLAQATETAQAANKAKSSFLAAMSHEIRTPMYGILGSIDVLRQSSLRPRQLEQTAIIRDSADSLLSIIDDILDFSKIEADKITLESEPVLLAYVIDAACIALTPIADRKNVRLDVYRTPSLPLRVRSDAVRLRQIITNLVSNAIKFSAHEAGTGCVQVDFSYMAAGELLIRVRDNGIGMDADTISVIFDSFSQADVSTTRRFGGTGLGLAITRRLVDLMQGRIDVDSTPGVGSTFTVTLPLPAEAEPAATADETDLQDVSVYLAVENENEAESWTEWLRHYGATVHAVQAEALPGTVPENSSGRTVILLSERQESGIAEALAPTLTARVQHCIVIARIPETRAQMHNEIMYVNRHSSHNQTVATVLAVIRGNLDALEAQAQRPVRPVSSIDREQARSTGRLILVAEDNEVNQDVIRNQLDTLGYACDIARHGLDALELWNRNPGDYALLLTDIHMPVMDGYELTAAIRCQEDAGHLPILAFTANATKGERAHCLDCGMDDYLTKPLSLETLEQKLHQWAAPHMAAKTSKPDLYDSSVLTASIGMNRARTDQLVAKFREAARAAGDQITTALQDQDLAQIVAVSHKLKSSSRAVGALALGDACARLEEDAKNRNNPMVEESVAVFLLTLDATLEILAAHAEGQGKDDGRTNTDTDGR